MNTETFEQELVRGLARQYRTTVEEATVFQLHNIISELAMENLAERWDASKEAHYQTRRACYLSMEFLVGRAIYNNLLSLGLTEVVSELLRKHGRSLSELEEIPDAALGNGGLGRLAACFLDSAAALKLPLDGYGIRYQYGLFEQTFENGCQKERADDWMRHGDPWSVRREDETVLVEYGDQTVQAVPYDMPVIGYGTNHCGTLRLWQAEPVHAFDFMLFNEQRYEEALAEKNAAETISRVLYPNDNTDEGKLLRIKQEYFFSSASISDVLRQYKKKHTDLKKLSDFITIQLNDTHPVIAIPEMMRQLCDIEGMSYEDALEQVEKIFNYTNHTLMPEALEQWPASMIEKAVPRVYAYVLMLNETYTQSMYAKKLPLKQIQRMKPVSDGMIRMAFLAMHVCRYTNGVARLHTEIIKKQALPEWYELYPERFQNKTNGITQRRWLRLCNPELSALITELLGSEEWVTDPERLTKLAKYAEDETILRRFLDIKHLKKQQLADYIAVHEGIRIDPNSIFDTQIKRLHEYKRQLLNAFSIMYLYYELKEGNLPNFTPTTFLFGAKAAPGYYRAKGIIQYIHEVARLIAKDPEVSRKIQVVFVQNYNVSYAEKLVAGSDVSEQISTAGTEASGTGNMKLMLNGTVTLGTYDGANVEIVEKAGPENNYIFGARVEELPALMKAYDPREWIEKHPKIKRVLNTLIDGTVSDGGNGVFRELYYALLDGASWHVPDHYYVLGDLPDYIEKKLQVNKDYNDILRFARKGWLNMCYAGSFSSDRTIKEYAEAIWEIRPVSIPD